MSNSKLVEALRLCALPYEGQAGALPAFVLVPFEVVIEFNDAYGAASKAGRLPMRGNRSIRQLDALFVEMGIATDREWLFSIDAMQRDARWERSRRLATNALASLHEQLRRPKFPDSTWISKSTGETIPGDDVPEPD